MKKITKLTESDLNRIAKRVVSEQSLPSGKNFKQLANMLEKLLWNKNVRRLRLE